jgi:hypothetical protein
MPWNERFEQYAAAMQMTAAAAYAHDPSLDRFRAWWRGQFDEWCRLGVDPNGTLTDQDVVDFDSWLCRKLEEAA